MEQRIIDNLKSLKSLLDSGVLTAEEFEAEKSKLLYKEVKNEPQEQTQPVQPKQQPTAQPEPPQTVQPKTRQETKPKETEKPACTSCKFNFLLWWAIIYIAASVVAEFIRNFLNIWSVEAVVSRNIFFLLLIIRHISNILPALAIKNKTYRIPCLIGVGLLSLYYINETVQNM